MKQTDVGNISSTSSIILKACSKDTAIDATADEAEVMVDEKKKSGQLGWQYLINYYTLCGSKPMLALYVIFCCITLGLNVWSEIQLAHFGQVGDIAAKNCSFYNNCDQLLLDNDELRLVFKL